MAASQKSARLGYALSSEEHPPLDLVRHAALAEEHGFEFALISDHFHPWIDRQGNSPFAWGVLGAIAQATDRLEVGTGVTCPTMRIHPAIVAQAAATAGSMMPGRFFLGVGTGENLNEHVLGQRWPEWDVRAEMLQEAVEVIRLLWRGDEASHHGEHFMVENARLYTLPEALPEIYVAGNGERMAAIAARIGDGFIGTGPDAEVIDAYKEAGGKGPRFGQVTVCWGRSAAAARRVAHAWWPTVAIHGDATQELPRPRHFEQLAEGVSEQQVADAIPCGPDPGPILEQIRAYLDAGYDHVYLHQVGPDQASFLEFAAKEILPAFSKAARVDPEGLVGANANVAAKQASVRPDKVRALVEAGRLGVADVRDLANVCRACDLWAHATQTVFGEGPVPARWMVVGEQPGDREDVAGHPFIGPAGRLLDSALSDAGIDRERTFVTNVVKHFKWRPDPRSKRRLHEAPSRSEVGACFPWVESELALVRPEALILLGASAAQAWLGPGFRVSRDHGLIAETSLAQRVVATIHPSAVLRARGAEAREVALRTLVKDLCLAG